MLIVISFTFTINSISDAYILILKKSLRLLVDTNILHLHADFTSLRVSLQNALQ